MSGIFGWSLSDGVTFDDVLAQDGNLYNEVDLKDSFSWGFSVGVLTSEQVEVGFLYNQQMSELQVKGAGLGGAAIEEMITEADSPAASSTLREIVPLVPATVISCAPASISSTVSGESPRATPSTITRNFDGSVVMLSDAFFGVSGTVSNST